MDCPSVRPIVRGLASNLHGELLCGRAGWHACNPRIGRNGAGMLVGSSIRRVAIIGGSRIPFARSMGVYAEASNQEMLTASLKGLVDKFNLRGEVLGDV